MTMLGENGKEDYTEDGTVDLKGRPVLRSNTGRWRACSFIVGIYKFWSPCKILFYLRKCEQVSLGRNEENQYSRDWQVISFYFNPL